MSTKMLSFLKNSYQAGTISRRDFMVRAIAAGLTISAASSLAGSVLAASAKKGGHYRWGSSSGSVSNTLNPIAGSGDFYLRSLFYSIRNCLVEIGPSGELMPELAESWESTDGKTWSFKIRKGVEFHNGKKMSVADVVASINAHRVSGTSTTSLAAPLLADVADLKADGDNLKVELKNANFDFPAILSFWQIGICPAKDETSIDWESGVGTGGYSLVGFEPGIRAQLKRNLNYWKSDRANFETVDLLVIADTNARTTALINGEVDSMDAPNRDTLALLKRKAGLKVEEVAGKYHNLFGMRVDRAPYDNVDVRTALKLAIDRQALVDTVFLGHGEVGNDHPVPRSSPNFASDLQQTTYDPDKAKFHLKKAGMEKLSVEMKIANVAWGGTAIDAAVLYREQAAKAGIDIKITRVPDDGYFASYDDFDFRGDNWAGRPTDNIMLTTAYATDAGGNIAHWQNERFNQLLVASRGEADEAKRHEMYVDMQHIIHDEGGVIVPVFTNWLIGVSDKIAHGELAGDWEMDGGRHVERWWFA